jgi:hydroxymethylglutaryl-CoA lyase
MARAKIYEMFLRDGLQSVRTIYTVQEKIAMFDILNKCNYNGIEIGSTTNPKLIPQVGGSMELWNHVKNNINNNNTKYTMLVPSIKHMSLASKEEINSYGFVLSVSDTFSKSNMKMSSEDSIKQVKEQISKVMNKSGYINNHMRIYLSCSFGCPWEGFSVTNLERTKRVVKELTDMAHLYNISEDNFDIVLADTVGVCDKYTMNTVLKNMYDLSYLGLHLHLPGKKNKLDIDQDFKDVVDVALYHDVYKYDTSLFGIGGCPYAKKSSNNTVIGNLSTIPLLKYFNDRGIDTSVNLELLENSVNDIDNIMELVD